MIEQECWRSWRDNRVKCHNMALSKSSSLLEFKFGSGLEQSSHCQLSVTCKDVPFLTMNAEVAERWREHFGEQEAGEVVRN